MNILAIDPGKKGAATVMSMDGEIIDVIQFSKVTEHDIAAAFIEYSDGEKCYAFIERVHSFPKMGRVPSFNLGEKYGFIRGLLVALKIPFETVLASKWQGALGCRSKGIKNITKAKAQQLFPGHPQITHDIADSILIAEYGRHKKQMEFNLV